MQQVLAEHLHRARNIMKAQADKKRTDRSFVIGDVVFVKLQPYVQTTVARRTNHKLSFRYFGPYKIIRIVNPVAYGLQLPTGAKVHPVFQVFHLCRASLLPLQSSKR